MAQKRQLESELLMNMSAYANGHETAQSVPLQSPTISSAALGVAPPGTRRCAVASAAGRRHPRLCSAAAALRGIYFSRTRLSFCCCCCVPGHLLFLLHPRLGDIMESVSL